jgi:hypothetical protein
MTKGSIELSAATSHCVARARAPGSRRQERLAPLTDVQDDGAGLEDDEAAFLQDRHLPERLQRAVVRLVLIALLEEARPVRQAGFLQRPTRAQIAHLATGEIRDPTEGRDRDHEASLLVVALRRSRGPRRGCGRAASWLHIQ